MALNNIFPLVLCGQTCLPHRALQLHPGHLIILKAITSCMEEKSGHTRLSTTSPFQSAWIKTRDSYSYIGFYLGRLFLLASQLQSCADMCKNVHAWDTFPRVRLVFLSGLTFYPRKVCPVGQAEGKHVRRTDFPTTAVLNLTSQPGQV